MSATPCPQANPMMLRWGEIVPCAKTKRHWKHENAEGTLQWWGPPLDGEEYVLIRRINDGEGKQIALEHMAMLDANETKLDEALDGLGTTEEDTHA